MVHANAATLGVRAPNFSAYVAEQARQGISAIRRFFGFGRKAEKNDASNEVDHAVLEKAATLVNDVARRPEGRAKAEGDEVAPSRHDWAGPAGTLLLFNCHQCAWTIIEGDTSLVESHNLITLSASFNMQVVGKVRPSAKMDEPFADRVELLNAWLPGKVHG